MRAIRVHEFGAPEVMRLETVPDPEPAADEVLVRVAAAGVNPVDTYIRAGEYGRLPPLPYTPGIDAAGLRADTGERVWVSGSLSGTYAELALCQPDQVQPLPDALSFAQGAALGVPYLTAVLAVAVRGALREGERVLVHGASGGVGVAAVQVALALGARVVGSAGSQAGRELVAAQGDVAVVDHRDPGHLGAALALSGGEGFDLVVECRAHVNLGADLRVLARGGRVVVVGSRGRVLVDPRDLMERQASVHGLLLGDVDGEERRRAVAAAAGGLAAGWLRPVVGRELPLSEAARAHRLLGERPALGKTVLVP